jgi:hypothetical protein
MDRDFRQRKPEIRYRAVLTAAGAAQTRYLPFTEEPNTTAAAIERASALWKQLEARRRSLVEQIDQVEEIRRDAA